MESTKDGLAGGCLCGTVRFRIAGPPRFAAACHCLDCQAIAGGAPAQVLVVARERLALLAGTPSVYRRATHSGSVMNRVFCAACGTPLWMWNDRSPDTLAVSIGTLPELSEFKPAMHFWAVTARPWHAFDPDAAVYDRDP